MADIIEYSRDPEILLRQLAPRFSRVALAPRWWDYKGTMEMGNYCYLQIERNGSKVASYPSLYLDLRRCTIKFETMTVHDFESGGSVNDFLEGCLFAAVRQILAPLSFEMMLNSKDQYFTLQPFTESPVGLHLPNQMEWSWNLLLPDDSPERKAYLEACHLDRTRRQTAPDVKGAEQKLNEALAALPALV